MSLTLVYFRFTCSGLMCLSGWTHWRPNDERRGSVDGRETESRRLRASHADDRQRPRLRHSVQPSSRTCIYHTAEHFFMFSLSCRRSHYVSGMSSRRVRSFVRSDNYYWTPISHERLE